MYIEQSVNIFIIIRNQRSEYKLQANGLAMSQTCGRESVMRSLPARRSRSPNYRSAGPRCFSFRTKLSRGIGWSSGFEQVYGFIRCLILLVWMTCCTAGLPRSSWIIVLMTYHGASKFACNTLDCHLCMIAVLDLQAQPHNSMPQGHIRVMRDLYAQQEFIVCRERR